MSQPTPQPDALGPADAELLELYLDGQLSSDRVAEAEARIAEVPAMQAAVAQQERIDDSLKRQHQAPAVSDEFLQTLLAGAPSESEPVRPLETEPSTNRVRDRRRMQLLAIAASLACFGTWSLLAWDELQQLINPPQGYARLNVTEVYQNAVRNGFRPDWLCEDDQEFAQTFADRQGQGLLLETLPSGVRMAGLAYLRGFTPQATSLFAYADEQPILVMVGRSDAVRDDLLRPAGVEGVTVFTRRLGDLTLAEVTPFDTPRVLDSLKLAEVPAEPTGHVPGAPYTE